MPNSPNLFAWNCVKAGRKGELTMRSWGFKCKKKEGNLTYHSAEADT